VPLLLDCCRLDPASMIYRQALRSAQGQLRPPRGPIALVRRWTVRRRLQTATRAGDWLKVLNLAEDMLALDPTNARAHLALATAFEALGQLDHAVWCLEQASGGNDRADSIVAELARLYERTGKFSLAQALTEPTTQANKEVGAVAAGLSLRLHAPQQAELDTFRLDASVAEQKLAQEPENKELQTILTRLRHEIQAREIDLCRQKADRYPADKSCHLDLGILLLKAGQFEAALEALEAARAGERVAWRAILYAAYCHLNMRQWHKAEPLFKEALALMPPEADTTRKEVLLLMAQHPLTKPVINPVHSTPTAAPPE